MPRNLGYQSLGRGASPLQQALQFAQIFKMMKPDESYPVTMPDGTTVNMSASEYSTWVRGLQSQEIQERGLSYEKQRVGLETRRVKELEKEERTMEVTMADGTKVMVTPEGYRQHKFDVAKEARATEAQTARLKTTIAKIGGEDVPMSPDAYADYMYQKSIEDPKHKIEISGQEVELDAGQYATYLINQAASDRAQKEQTERLKRYTVNVDGKDISLDAGQYATYSQNEERIAEAKKAGRTEVALESGKIVEMTPYEAAQYEINKRTLALQEDKDSVYEKKQEEIGRTKTLVNTIRKISADYISTPTATELQKEKYKPKIGEKPFSFEEGPVSWLLPKSIEGTLERGLPRNMKPYTDRGGKDFSDAANTQISKINNLIQGVKTDIDEARLGTEYDEVTAAYRASGMFEEMDNNILQLVDDLKYQEFLSTPRKGFLKWPDEAKAKESRTTLDRIKLQLAELQRIQDLIKIERDRIAEAQRIKGGIQFDLMQAQ